MSLPYRRAPSPVSNEMRASGRRISPTTLVSPRVASTVNARPSSALATPRRRYLGERREKAEGAGLPVARSAPARRSGGPVHRDKVGGGIEQWAERLARELFCVPSPAPQPGTSCLSASSSSRSRVISASAAERTSSPAWGPPSQPGHRRIGLFGILAGARRILVGAGVQRVIPRFQGDVQGHCRVREQQHRPAAGRRSARQVLKYKNRGYRAGAGAHLARYQVAIQSAPRQRRSHPGYRQSRCNHAP